MLNIFLFDVSTMDICTWPFSLAKGGGANRVTDRSCNSYSIYQLVTGKKIYSKTILIDWQILSLLKQKYQMVQVSEMFGSAA